jgi:hypothetical protein
MRFVAHPPFRSGQACAALQHALCSAAARPSRSAPAALTLRPSARSPQPFLPLSRPPPASPQTSSPALDQPAGGRASPAPTVVLLPFPPYTVLALACRGLACAPTAAVAPQSDSFFHRPQNGVKGGSKKARFFQQRSPMPRSRSPPVTLPSPTGRKRSPQTVGTGSRQPKPNAT